MREHPTPAVLDAFLRGELSRDGNRGVVRHLLRGCVSCAAQLREEHARLTADRWGESVFDASSYTEVLDRASKTARHLQREAARAREVTSLLVKGGIKAVVQDGDLPLRGLGVYHALLERSWVVRYESPREMVSLARAATEVAERLDSMLYGTKRIFDLKARAWGELANAFRVSDDFEEAERAFGIAFDLLLKGSDDLYIKARLYDLNASYLGTCCCFSLAFASLDLVHRSYLELGERHLAGRALITKAIYTHYDGNSEAALQINAQGLTMVDRDRDPELVFQAFHNQLWFLVACSRFRDAKRALFLRQADLQKCGGEISRLKLRWLQGQICYGLGELGSAEVAFWEARQGFESAGLGFAAALASLDLALLFLHQEKNLEAEDLVAEAVEVFLAVGVHREALSSILILRDSFEKRQGSIILLESVIEFLRRSQIDPDARFTPRFE